MYTQINSSGERDLRIENIFSDYEGRFQKIKKDKFEKTLSLTDTEHLDLCRFVAIQSSRTRSHLDHITSQWKRPLEMGEQLLRQMNENPKKFELLPSFSDSDQKNQFSIEQIREIVNNPVGTIMISSIDHLVARFFQMDYSLLIANENDTFITNDSPVIWNDPEQNIYPPSFRRLGLLSKTIEICFPISPKYCLLLNWQGVNGYIPINHEMVSNMNQTIRTFASKYFISNKNHTDEHWFIDQ
jgi:Protein of unknown function (DUF4238)